MGAAQSSQRAPQPEFAMFCANGGAEGCCGGATKRRSEDGDRSAHSEAVDRLLVLLDDVRSIHYRGVPKLVGVRQTLVERFCSTKVCRFTK